MNRLMGVLDKLLLSLSQWFTKSGLSPRSHSIFVALFSTGISWFDQFYHSITEVPDYFLMLVFVSLTNTLANVYASTATHSSIGEHCPAAGGTVGFRPCAVTATALHHWQITQWPHYPDPQGPSSTISQPPCAQPQLLLASVPSHCPLRRGSAHQ